MPSVEAGREAVWLYQGKGLYHGCQALSQLCFPKLLSPVLWQFPFHTAMLTKLLCSIVEHLVKAERWLPK